MSSKVCLPMWFITLLNTFVHVDACACNCISVSLYIHILCVSKYTKMFLCKQYLTLYSGLLQYIQNVRYICYIKQNLYLYCYMEQNLYLYCYMVCFSMHCCYIAFTYLLSIFSWKPYFLNSFIACNLVRSSIDVS